MLVSLLVSVEGIKRGLSVFVCFFVVPCLGVFIDLLGKRITLNKFQAQTIHHRPTQSLRKLTHTKWPSVAVESS